MKCIKIYQYNWSESELAPHDVLNGDFLTCCSDVKSEHEVLDYFSFSDVSM